MSKVLKICEGESCRCNHAKVKINEVWEHLFFTPMSRLGPFFCTYPNRSQGPLSECRQTDRKRNKQMLPNALFPCYAVDNDIICTSIRIISIRPPLIDSLFLISGLVGFCPIFKEKKNNTFHKKYIFSIYCKLTSYDVELSYLWNRPQPLLK